MFDFEDFQRTGGPVRSGLLMTGRGLEGLAALPLLAHLERENTPLHFVAGSGGAALVVGALAAGHSASALLELAHKLKPRVLKLDNPSAAWKGLFQNLHLAFDVEPDRGAFAGMLRDEMVDAWVGRADFPRTKNPYLIVAPSSEGHLDEWTDGAMSNAVFAALSTPATLPVQAGLKRGLTNLVGVAPASLGLKVGSGAVDRGNMPHGVLLPVDLPRAAPWDLGAVAGILAAGEKALNQALPSLDRLLKKQLQAA
ncbi:MAG: hypothetical protein ACPGNT_03685 [Rhodospirillales bacterium]